MAASKQTFNTGIALGLGALALYLIISINLARAGVAANFFSAPGHGLLTAFSWASILVPIWLVALAYFIARPGLNVTAFFVLCTSLVPMVLLAIFAHITNRSDPWINYFPKLANVGYPTLIIVTVVLLLLSILMIILVSLILFAKDGDEETSMVRKIFSLPAPRVMEKEQDTQQENEFTQEADPVIYATAPVESEAPISATHSENTQSSSEATHVTIEESEPLPLYFNHAATQEEVNDEDVITVNFKAQRAAADEVTQGTASVELDDATESAEENVNTLDSTVLDIPQHLNREIENEAQNVAKKILEEKLAKKAEKAKEKEKIENVINNELTEAEKQEAEALAAINAVTIDANEATVIEENTEQKKRAAVERILARQKKSDYFVPTDTILNSYPDGQYWIIDEETKRAGEILAQTLHEFKISAEVTGIRKGPVITMFEILPAPGVKLSRITNLGDNIALRLAASSVRIVAPIPGKHAVGIEVPNHRRSLVSLREIVENEKFTTAKMEVPVILGKDITGEAQFIDLVKTPHLLIAGSTGSGKSVCVNSLILSILFSRSPEEVKLILVDPKIVELKLYNDIPHLLTPVITEPKKAFQALQYCLCEMERRYSMLDRVGVRDIMSYNRKIREKNIAQEKLPYIITIIDEFADLMATTGKELESTLARLAAMSRAVGIHLVLATQRPSIDVITGLIKANIPSRVAFMVASKFDSRIIIDMVGAEKLLGKGDMLFASSWDPFPVRIQGAFVTEDEVEKAVTYVKTLGAPEYIDDEIFIDDEDEELASILNDEDDDPLFEQALQIVMQQGKASASYIQRRLKIGYNRAARLVELMEEKGIVGPAQGSKPREVVRGA